MKIEDSEVAKKRREEDRARHAQKEKGRWEKARPDPTGKGRWRKARPTQQGGGEGQAQKGRNARPGSRVMRGAGCF